MKHGRITVMTANGCERDFHRLIDQHVAQRWAPWHEVLARLYEELGHDLFSVLFTMIICFRVNLPKAPSCPEI